MNYKPSAVEKDLEIRICFETNRFPFAMQFSGSLSEISHLSVKTVDNNYKIYTAEA